MEKIAQAEPFIHLILHYCNHRLPEREAEYNFCFRKNLANPYVKQVHNIVDPATTVPDEFRSHPKYVEHQHPGQWMSYKTALDYINSRLAGEVVCIANLDIFLDNDSPWPEAKFVAENNIVLSLSRLEYNADGTYFKDPGFERVRFANTQDLWLFLAPFEVDDCDFDIGTLGCDNAFAHRIRAAGRIPLNAPHRLRIFHYDVARGKTLKNQAQVHDAERGALGNAHPEDRGQFLVPAMDMVQDLEELSEWLKLSPVEKYVVACEMLNRKISVRNR